MSTARLSVCHESIAPQQVVEPGANHELAALTAQIGRRRRGSAPRGPHRLEVLLDQLSRPQDAFTSVRVIGTNGKTSVTKMLAATLQAHGVTTADTTSPHLQCLTERICIAGKPVDTRQLHATLSEVERSADNVAGATDDPVTFFELVLASAAQMMRQATVDIAVIEAGIGGVGDATQAFTAPVMALTPIGCDHPELGDTIEAVATEKATAVSEHGIMVVGRQTPSAARAISAVAAARHATTVVFGRDFAITARENTADGQRVTVALPTGRTVTIGLRSPVPVHADNAAHAIAIADVLLENHRVSVSAAALNTASVPGRLERIDRPDSASVLLDGAHDAMALGNLAANVDQCAPGVPRTVIIGMSGQHRHPDMFRTLLGQADHVVATAAPAPGAWSAQRLADALCPAPVVAACSPQQALAWASKATPATGSIVVTGSLHLVGVVRQLLLADSNALP